jgi:branched-chain amino acid transport system substrate-binding protein
MTKTTLRRLSAGALALVLASTGCGLKKEAYQQLTSARGGVVAPGEAALGGGDPGTVGGPSAPGTVPGGPVPGGKAGSGATPGAGGQPGTGGGSAGQPGTGGGGGGGGTPSGPGTKIGVSAKEIRIGIHAPISGASPLPAEAFRSGANLYWKNKTVFGRKVVVEVMDDQYKPSVARQVCGQMAERDFIVIGGAGTDQIQSCGTSQELARTNTPYLSAGVTTNGLTNRPNYFAFTLTYAQQGPVVVKLAKSRGASMSKWAIVASATPNFDDAVSAIKGALGGTPTKVFRTPKDGNESDAANLARDLAAYGAPTVYFLTAPKFWIYTVGSASSLFSYNPHYVGPGVSMGVNQVASAVCATANKTTASYLAPYMGLDREPREFAAAGPSSKPEERDIHLTLYGLSEVLHKALLKTNGNLTRENFIAQIARASYGNVVFPPVRFGGGHFGGTAAWGLKLDCSSRTWKTATSGPIR